MDGFYLWLLFVFNSLFLFGIEVSFVLKELQLFEEVKNKENMRREHLYLAGLGTIGLSLLFVGAIFVV
jgi:hypothetical protein